MTETRLYKEMVKVKQEKECSTRQLAVECGISYLTLVQFYNPDMPFKLITDKTKYKLHNHLGIPYEIIDEYNEILIKERS